MKKILSLLLLLTVLAFSYSNFCDGYKSGYSEGYCYEKRFCISPKPPKCPQPKPGENSFSNGYYIGFSDGVKHGK